ncbi:MAG: RNA-binding protein [Bacteroidales bacterium]|nr:RNA-binding protein [Bacteroidales bacterium]MDD4821299.1 RNA-binding protein [Bacteroidales bacterium]
MNIYVGNLSFNVTDSDLQRTMEEFGEVVSVKLIIDRMTNRSKGFAFVEMPNKTEAINAIKKLNGYEYDGRPMSVKEAIPKY